MRSVVFLFFRSLQRNGGGNHALIALEHAPQGSVVAEAALQGHVVTGAALVQQLAGEDHALAVDIFQIPHAEMLLEIAAEVGVAQGEATFNVLEDQGEWLKIEYNGQTGYVKAEFFE